VAADVAAVGDPETGFDVRETYGYTGWITIGGTSLSSPLIAAMFALAGGSGGSAYPAASLYVNSARQPGARYDVTQGGNGFCGGETDLQRCMTVTAAMPLSANNNPNALYDEPIDCSFNAGGQAVTTAPAPGRQCNAQPGYDGPTGLGTPIGLGLFRATSATGALVGPATPRLHRAQRWSSTLRPRLSGASITSYSWSWGDGTQSRTTAASAAHTYTRAGHYKVTLSATDALSQVVVRTRTIRVGQAPSVHYSGPQRLAAGRRGTFSAAGTHAVNTGAHLSTVTWSWGDGHRTHLTSTRRVTHRYAHTGRYRVTLTVRDSTGVSRSVRHTVRVS
jgi:hypothetical protein